MVKAVYCSLIVLCDDVGGGNGVATKLLPRKTMTAF
jgi:hypothetical protein